MVGGQEKDFAHPTKNLLYSIICGSVLNGVDASAWEREKALDSNIP